MKHYWLWAVSCPVLVVPAKDLSVQNSSTLWLEMMAPLNLWREAWLKSPRRQLTWASCSMSRWPPCTEVPRRRTRLVLNAAKGASPRPSWDCGNDRDVASWGPNRETWATWRCHRLLYVIYNQEQQLVKNHFSHPWLQHFHTNLEHSRLGLITFRRIMS